MVKHQRKRRKSKASPNTSPDSDVLTKKHKQSVILKKTLPDVDSQSESDYFLDAEDRDSIDDQNSSGQSTLSTDQVANKTMDDTVPPSQSLLSTQPPGQSTPVGVPGSVISTLPPVLHAGSPITYQQQVPQMSQMSQMPQFPPVYQQFTLSDSDILRIATQVKVMISEEIDRLITDKVNLVTADLRQSIDILSEENRRLRSSISDVEAKMSAKIDDLEQYSRRSCLRIVGIKESERENTDEVLLNLATRLNVEIHPEDIDRSHRVGPQKPTAVGEQRPSSNPPRPREIIVKFRNHQARLAFLKGRAALREKREKLFINEDLTQNRRNLAYQCRQLKREKKVQKTWVYDGNVFISENNGSRVKIFHASQLDIYKTATVPKAPSEPMQG